MGGGAVIRRRVSLSYQPAACRQQEEGKQQLPGAARATQSLAHEDVMCGYLLCEIVSEDPRCRQCIDERAVSAAAKDAVARTHGDYGLACCSISFTGLHLPLLPPPRVPTPGLGPQAGPDTISRSTARTPETGGGLPINHWAQGAGCLFECYKG
nr:ribonuclease P/MRP protein subunit POP5 isoform X6 [Chrysemys picta bellii]